MQYCPSEPDGAGRGERAPASDPRPWGRQADLPQKANFHTNFGRTSVMLRWAIAFLVIALIAGALGLGNVAGTSSYIAWILFVVFLILTVVSFICLLYTS